MDCFPNGGSTDDVLMRLALGGYVSVFFAFLRHGEKHHPTAVFLRGCDYATCRLTVSFSSLLYFIWTHTDTVCGLAQHGLVLI